MATNDSETARKLTASESLSGEAGDAFRECQRTSAATHMARDEHDAAGRIP